MVLFHIGRLAKRLAGHKAPICLGETQTDAFNHFDLCYSFKVLCQAGVWGEPDSYTMQLRIMTVITG